MKTRTKLLMAGAVLSLCSTMPVGAHVSARALIVHSPHHPMLGQPCHVAVSLKTAAGLASFAQRVWLVGEMAHPMRPVTAELHRIGDSGNFEGDITFTMTGGWKVTLQVQDGSAVLWGPFDLEVVEPGHDTGAEEMRNTVDLYDPLQSQFLSPTWVLAGAILLTGTLQTVAIVFERKRRKANGRGGRAAS